MGYGVDYFCKQFAEVAKKCEYCIKTVPLYDEKFTVLYAFFLHDRPSL